jgi:uncharacterized protein (TIGR03086 family)
MTLRSTDPLAQALATARSVLVQVDEDDLCKATPCRSWDVRGLINHMVGAPRVAAGRMSGVSGATEEDFVAGDYLAAHDESAALAMAAFSAPGALERPVELPFGTLPAAMLLFFVASDQVTHAWDLATAIGSSTDLSPRLAAQLLEEANETVGDQLRGGDGDAAFGLEQTAPPGASAADRLAAFLGRSV